MVSSFFIESLYDLKINLNFKFTFLIKYMQLFHIDIIYKHLQLQKLQVLEQHICWTSAVKSSNWSKGIPWLSTWNQSLSEWPTQASYSLICKSRKNNSFLSIWYSSITNPFKIEIISGEKAGRFTFLSNARIKITWERPKKPYIEVLIAKHFLHLF